MSNNKTALITGASRGIGAEIAEEFENIFKVNVTGVFNTLKQAAIKLNVDGSIVNISSTVTRTMFPGYGPNCATKGAVEQLTRVFSKEMGQKI